MRAGSAGPTGWLDPVLTVTVLDAWLDEDGLIYGREPTATYLRVEERFTWRPDLPGWQKVEAGVIEDVDGTAEGIADLLTDVFACRALWARGPVPGPTHLLAGPHTGYGARPRARDEVEPAAVAGLAPSAVLPAPFSPTTATAPRRAPRSPLRPGRSGGRTSWRFRSPRFSGHRLPPPR